MRKLLWLGLCWASFDVPLESKLVVSAAKSRFNRNIDHRKLDEQYKEDEEEDDDWHEASLDPMPSQSHAFGLL